MKRAQAWEEVRRRQMEYSSAVDDHGSDSAEARDAWSAYRRAAEQYRFTLVSDFEDEVRDHMSR